MKAKLDRTLLGPYVRHVFLAARDASDKKLFPGCGEVFVDKMIANVGGSQNLLDALEHSRVDELAAKGKLKPDKAMEIAKVWKSNQLPIEQLVVRALPKEWKAQGLHKLGELESKFVRDKHAELLQLVRSKESLLKVKHFLLARGDKFALLPVEMRLRLHAKAALRDSFQVCLAEAELARELGVEDDPNSLSSALVGQPNDPLFTKQGDFYYLSSVCRKEAAVARDLARRAGNTQGRMPAFDLSQAELDVLSPSQRLAVELAMRTRVFCLTGGPGTGKTFVLGKMLKSWEAAGAKVVVCTHTARGANNLKKVAQAKQAMTIHRALGAYAVDEEANRSRYRVDLVKCDVFILDEATLVDLAMMRDILARLHVDTMLVLMGDKDQLPSIGQGSVFRDLLALESTNKVGKVVLSEPRRYSSQLHQLAMGILRGGPKAMDVLRAHKATGGKQSGGDEVVWIPLQGRDVKAEAQREVGHILRKHAADKDSIQVLVRQGAQDWNRTVLRELFLGPELSSASALSTCSFVASDRVMHLKNNLGLDVVNGEIGTVATVGGTRAVPEVVVDYPDNKQVRYVGHTALADLSYSYAMTVHKAQGCEFPVVILIVTGFPKWTRELLYTACTRTKRHLYVIGSEWDLKHAMDTLEPHRHSNLGKQVEDAMLLASSGDLAISGLSLESTPSAPPTPPPLTAPPKNTPYVANPLSKTCNCPGFLSRGRCVHVDLL